MWSDIYLLSDIFSILGIPEEEALKKESELFNKLYLSRKNEEKGVSSSYSAIPQFYFKVI